MRTLLRSMPRILGLALVWLLLLMGAAWAFGALWFDFPIIALRHALAAVFLCSVLAAFAFVRPSWRVKLGLVVAFALISAWWLTLEPHSDRNRQPDVAQTARAEIEGNLVKLHDVRNFDYRTKTDFTPHWETRTARLSQITGIDLAVNYWGSPCPGNARLFNHLTIVPPGKTIKNAFEKITST